MRTAVTEAQLAEIVPNLAPGQSVVYYVGHLCQEKYGSPGYSIAALARQMSDMMIPDAHGSLFVGMGLVTLVQRRVVNGYEYLAVRLRG